MQKRTTIAFILGIVCGEIEVYIWSIPSFSGFSLFLLGFILGIVFLGLIFTPFFRQLEVVTKDRDRWVAFYKNAKVIEREKTESLYQLLGLEKKDG